MSVAEQEEEDVTASEENSKLEVRLRKEGYMNQFNLILFCDDLDAATIKNLDFPVTSALFASDGTSEK